MPDTHRPLKVEIDTDHRITVEELLNLTFKEKMLLHHFRQLQVKGYFHHVTPGQYVYDFTQFGMKNIKAELNPAA